MKFSIQLILSSQEFCMLHSIFFLFLPFAKENRKKRQHLKKERSLHVLIKHRLMKDIQDLLEKDSFFFFFFFF